MALKLYNQSHELFGSDPLRTTHDGQLGGPSEQIFYLRNDSDAVYFTSIVVSVEMLLYRDWGEFGDTGWGIKLMWGERRPTEAEWDFVRSGDDLLIGQLGTTNGADTTSYVPVWVRVYCPAGAPAQIRDNLRIRIRYIDNEVGA